MQEIHYHTWVHEHQFFNALIGCHPILYLALGLAATLLLPLVATRLGVNQIQPPS